MYCICTKIYYSEPTNRRSLKATRKQSSISNYKMFASLICILLMRD